MYSDRTKFNEILNKEDVKVSDQGDICLNDFVRKIVGSKNVKSYIDRLPDYKNIVIDNEKYIGFEDCVEILENSKFKSCKDICKEIEIKKDRQNYINLEKELKIYFDNANIRLIRKCVFDEDNEYCIEYYLLDYTIILRITNYENCVTDKKCTKNINKYFGDSEQCLIIECNPEKSDYSVMRVIGALTRMIISREKDKREQLQIKYMELRNIETEYEYQMKKLESETNIAVKKLEAEISLAMKKTELEILRKKNKRIAIEKGYNLRELGYN